MKKIIITILLLTSSLTWSSTKIADLEIGGGTTPTPKGNSGPANHLVAQMPQQVFNY
jgi:hypothetical protein